MKRDLSSLEWIARLSPENCPGGVPADEVGWRTLVNRIVQDVRRVLSEQCDRSDPSDTLIPQARWLPAPQELPGGLAGL
ncbi:MAG: hypothetical protein ACKJSK_05305 [Roseibacillus sp.]